MRSCFIGTGGSWPTKTRNPTAITISSGGTNILLDCGEGTQKQLLHSHVSPMKIDAVLISHLHGDHFLGLPGLVQTMSLNDRNRKLEIYGPKGIKRSFEMGMQMCPNHPKFQTEVTELETGDRIMMKDLTIETISSTHSIETLGYRISERDRPGKFNRERALELGIPEGRYWGQLQSGKDVELVVDGEKRTFSPDMVLGPKRKGRSIGYTGDTAPTEEHVDFFHGVDLLIHEATYTEDLKEKAKEYFHSTAKEAATIAKRANVKRLCIFHSSPRYSGDGEDIVLLEEARSVFSETIMPDDLEVVEINL
jgi:ribonuclease Z